MLFRCKRQANPSTILAGLPPFFAIFDSHDSCPSTHPVMQGKPGEKWILAKYSRAQRICIHQQRREQTDGERSSSSITMSQSVSTTKRNPLGDLTNVLASHRVRSSVGSSSYTPEYNDATTSAQLQRHKRQRINDLSSISRAINFNEDFEAPFSSHQTSAVDSSIENFLSGKLETKDGEGSSSRITMSQSGSATKINPLGDVTNVMQSQTNEKWFLAKDARARRKHILQEIREHNDGQRSSSRVTISESRSTKKNKLLADVTNASHQLRSSIENSSRALEYNYETTLAQLQACERQRLIDLPSITRAINFSEDVEAHYSSNKTDAVHTSIDNILFGKAEIKETLDFDDPSFKCRFCGALLWYEERAEKSRGSSHPEFSICCMKEKVQLPLLQKPPDLLFNLFNGIDARSSHFMKNIRKYNCMFSFTSLEGKIETSQNNGRAAPQFTLRGKNDHNIGSLLPQDGGFPKYTQLYIYDTQNEVANRMSHYSKGKNGMTTDRSLVEDLKFMIDQHNILAQSFRRTRDFMEREPTTNVSLRLLRTRCRDSRTYNIPTVDEVAALIVGDFNSSDAGRDVIVRKRCGFLQRIHETHPSFIPLQYPLLFPWGEDGYEEEIPIRESFITDKNVKRAKVSMREFIAFRIHERDNDGGILVRA